MKLTINKNILTNALNTVSLCLNSKAPLSNYLFMEATPTGLTFKATSGEQSMIHTVNDTTYECTQPGIVLLPSGYFISCIKSALSEEITLIEENGILLIKAGRGKMSLHLANISNFPKIDFPLSLTSLEISQTELCKLIDQTIFATGENVAGRPILTGVNFASENGNLRVCSTDSFRLSKVNTGYILKEPTSVTISKETLNIVKKFCGKLDENVQISFTERAVYFKLPNTILKSVLLAGNYPAVINLIPRDFNYELTCNREELLSLLKSGMFIKADNGLPVFKLEISETEANLINKNSEIGEFNMPLENFSYKGEPFNLHFDGTYLFDALKVIESETVIIKFVSDMRPFIIVSPNDDKIVELMLPVRTYD